MTFRVGQEVVCVRGDGDSWIDDCGGVCPGPEKNEVLKIVWITYVDGEMGLCFAEYPNDYDGFVATAFRPVVKTDISIFTAMLDRAPTQETADA